ncbi:MAG: putative sulfate exporter family transporter [Acidimicrobiia bacterium]|nr:putative sulfate exporter family transporter [Acidimicrobiia bacterium]
MGTQTESRQPGFWENLLFGTTLDQVPTLIPGVVLASVVVLIAAGLAELLNGALGYDGLISFILVAIVLGMIIRNTVGLKDTFAPGVSFTLKKVLRLGIILLGIRLSFLDVLEVGGFGIPIVLGAVLTGLVFTTAVTRWLGLSDRLGTLIAVGTGICGATAIVATAPGIKAKEQEVAYAVADITVFGIAAMFLYPFLGDLIFDGDVTQVGLFLGTSIHETAQVAGAGLIYDQSFDITTSPSGADIAVIAKLVRNAFMVVAIPAVTYVYARRRDHEELGEGHRTELRKLFPVFILGFLLMAAIRSLGDAAVDSGGQAFGVFDAEMWSDVTRWIRTWAEYTLATAMAGVGLGTSIEQLKGLGFKPFVVGITAALAVGVASIGLVSIFGPMISV